MPLYPDRQQIKPDLTDLAYVVYTAGSRTPPKGVMVEQGAVIDRLQSLQSRYALDDTDTLLLQTPCSCDLSVSEWLAGLVSGARVSLLGAQLRQQLVEIVAQIERDSISVIHFVPSLLSAFLDLVEIDSQAAQSLSSLKRIFCSGEALPASLLQRFNRLVKTLGLQARLVNMYGSAEVGTHVSYFDCPVDADADILIGTPAANCRLYVVSEGGSLAPEGVPGELLVGGAQLARGYLNAPALTREKFISDPYASVRLYKTGDLAYWLPGGRLAFVGRREDRVKIRGVRVQPAWIEHWLLQIAAVKAAAVAAHTDAQAEPRLAAYVVLREPPAKGESGQQQQQTAITAIKAALQQQLPDYALPDVYVLLDELPLNRHGKVDRNALPVPDAGDVRKTGYVAPRNEIEERLCQLWQQVLKRTQIGVHDNFFKAGGHSLLATQLISRIRQVFNVELPITALFEAPVLEALAHRIVDRLLQGQSGRLPASIPAAHRGQAIPLSYSQERLWFIHEHMEDQRTSYNITFALHLQGSGLSIDTLHRAFNALVARHETLRTTFRVPEAGARAQQFISDALTIEIPVLEVAEAEVQPFIAREAGRSFDLVEGPLVKVCILRLTADRHVLMFSIHHIICDGWSLNIMFRDLQQLYKVQLRDGEDTAQLRGGEAPLPPLPIQYADYVLWQRQQDLSAHLDYWQSALGSYEEGLELPYDYPRPSDRAWRVQVLRYAYPAELAQRLAALSQSQQITLFMSLLASFAIVLNQYTGRDDLCIGTTTAGRDQLELEDLIGFFINILPLRLDLSGNPTAETILQNTRQVVLQGFEHRALPFEHLLNALQKQRDSSQIPLVPVILRHQNFPETKTGEWIEGIAMQEVEIGYNTTPNELDLQFYGDGSYLEVAVEYAADLFAAATIQRLIAHHQQVLETLVANPACRLADFSVLTPAEHQLFSRLNDTARGFDTATSLAARFESQAQATPDAIACYTESGHISYRELNVRANHLAHRLLAAGVGPEVRVALACERSLEFLLGMLAVFKAGGCYVPVDPQYPLHYRQQILADAQPQLVIDRIEADAGYPHNNPQRPVDPAHLCCVMYTSGSTGEPKGVMVPYGQVLNWLQAAWQR